jgi:hypothetical protein
METALFEEKNTFLCISGSQREHNSLEEIETKVKIFSLRVCTLIEAGRDGESQSIQNGNGHILAYIPS